MKLHFDASKPVMKWSTIHSFKGLESPTVIAILQSSGSDTRESELEVVYTALSRARANLFILEYGSTRYGDQVRRIFGKAP